MKRAILGLALLGAIAAHAPSAGAVNLSPNGMGQVLIYPYYTVNAGQQTLLTIVNGSSVGKALKVRFLEAYNGREVLDFNLFLVGHDVWTAPLFKLSDAGIAGDGAAIFTTDASCMAPQLTEGPLANGHGYQAFLDYAYTGSNSDTGPISDSRTNEGHFEVIAMADVVAGSALDQDITPVDGVPPGCARAEADFESDAGTVAPSSGVFGSASIVDVAEGTFYAYNADALDGFTSIKLLAPTGSLAPSLASANDPCCAATVTAHVFSAGLALNAVYPTTQAIDAVSALFVADSLYNEYVTTSDGTVGTDWVVTFPTKRFYVDRSDRSASVPPFDHAFGALEPGNGRGLSCSQTWVHVFDRDATSSDPRPCGYECPPGPEPPSLCLETNVLRFSGDSVLGSELPHQPRVAPLVQGLVQLDLAYGYNPHEMRPAADGRIFRGLPATGFAVTRYVNGTVPAAGGGTTLANYGAAYRHRATVSCSTAGPRCP